MKKVILITGASSGIGKATALQLILEGHIVYGAARRLRKMDDLVTAGGQAMELDVTDHDQIRAGVQKVLEEQGQIDVLVNNAGYAEWGSVENTSYETARRQFEVNIFGLAEMTKAVIPIMRAQGSGKIINISSVGGKVYSPLGAWYHGTKHALEGWSDCLRLELKQFGIDVVIVEPGAIGTEFNDVLSSNFREATTDGPYTQLAKALDAAQKNAEENSSPPSVIAHVISKAIKARRPKTRYATGKLSGQVLFFRKWFSDRAFDRTILRMVNNMGKKAQHGSSVRAEAEQTHA